jgi:hypothetical protein
MGVARTDTSPEPTATAVMASVTVSSIVVSNPTERAASGPSLGVTLDTLCGVMHQRKQGIRA